MAEEGCLCLQGRLCLSVSRPQAHPVITPQSLVPEPELIPDPKPGKSPFPAQSVNDSPVQCELAGRWGYPGAYGRYAAAKIDFSPSLISG